MSHARGASLRPLPPAASKHKANALDIHEDDPLDQAQFAAWMEQASHLFLQGVVSGELFVSDPAFRAKLNEKLPDGHKLVNIGQRPDPRDYEVVFAIISKSAKPLDIPFFSKVSLRNARRRLEGYGYRVSKKKILVNAGV